VARIDRHRSKAIPTAVAKPCEDGARRHPDAEAFFASPSNSIDYAVMGVPDRW
jgi:mannose-1-phosphate guanylyltransferase